MHKSDEECSYGCLTIIALCITLCSAVLTFLVASYMYTGVNDGIELPPELKMYGSDRLVVPRKQVILFKLDMQNRCYILPAYLAKKLVNTKFTVVDEALSPKLLRQFTGAEGADFCGFAPAYLLQLP